MKMQDKEKMSSEYKLDYSKAKPNRFAKKYNQLQRTVVLDSDVAENFPDAESVNEALRSLVRSTEEKEAELQTK
jgi:hypothetical protein